MRNDPKKVLGIIFILAGVLIWLNRADILPDYLSWAVRWYMILIAIGVYQLVKGSRQGGIVLLIIGTAFLLADYDLFDLEWKYILPLILVLVGLSFFFRNHIGPQPLRELSDASFDSSNILGGSKQIVLSNPLRGGRITCILGGAEIDLRKAVPEDGAVIHIFTFMGGAEIKVPAEWNVSIENSSILGGFEDKRDKSGNAGSGPLVRITGTNVLGGCELKS